VLTLIYRAARFIRSSFRFQYISEIGIGTERKGPTLDIPLSATQRRFDAPIDKIEGTIKSASFHGVELSEYPGRVFHFSAVGSSMADLTADQLGKANAMTRGEAAGLADNKLRERDVYLSTALLENSRNRHAGVVHRNRPFSPRAGPSFSPAAVPGRGFRPLP
jgi:hypothetical protein